MLHPVGTSETKILWRVPTCRVNMLHMHGLSKIRLACLAIFTATLSAVIHQPFDSIPRLFTHAEA